MTDLPDSVTVGGAVFPVRTSYRAWLSFEAAAADTTLPPERRLFNALTAVYVKNMPRDIPEAVEAALWFYRCGADEPKSSGGSCGGTLRRAYDFKTDEGRINAAFLEVYGVNLWRCDLHWWQFRPMLECLPETNTFSRIMSLRTMPLAELDPVQRRKISRLRSRYAIDAPQNRESLDERDRRWMQETAAAFDRLEDEKWQTEA